ncbi:MAG: dTMP kinase [Myxococcales bacterium]|nr:dTMP kinase [Myxococcales bacterium]
MVFEGIDGAGTTTQLARYGAHLRSLGQAVHLTREPSAGPVGSMLRLALSKRLELGGATHAQTMALLFAADRLDHVAHEIEPHLALGTHVLSDRYDLSSLAYQTATTEPAHNPGVDAVLWVRSLNRFALRPDATVVLDVSPDVAAQRRDTRAAQIELYERQDLQAKLAALYRDAERLVPGDCILHIDGNASADAVTFAVIAALAPRR